MRTISNFDFFKRIAENASTGDWIFLVKYTRHFLKKFICSVEIHSQIAATWDRICSHLRKTSIYAHFSRLLNLIIEALAKAYEARVLIHVDEIQQHQENNVGVDFPKIIRLIKTAKDYKLLNVSRNNEEKEESDVGCALRFVIMLT